MDSSLDCRFAQPLEPLGVISARCLLRRFGEGHDKFNVEIELKEAYVLSNIQT